MRVAFVMLFALLATLLPGTAPAADVVIKIASLAPDGSTWHKALRRMADEWAQITDGKVEVKIYAGGVAGNETVMLRKMRIGQLHGGAFTNLGLIEIDPGPQVINIPGLIQNYGELDYVADHLNPVFEERIWAKGYKVVQWGDVGWVHLFSKDPLLDPARVGDMKIFAWEGDPAAVEMYKKGGFNPVVVAATDIMPSLQSGLLDGYPATPLASLATQWFALAPNMLDVPWAPMMGAVIISKDAWNAIPAEYHDRLLEAARRTGDETKATIRRQDTKAIEIMKQYGLKVNTPDAATRKRWDELAASVHPFVRGNIVPADIFDRTKALLAEHRAQHP